MDANTSWTQDSLNVLKTVELRKVAKTYGLKEVGGRPVNSGRKADLIEHILKAIETLTASDEAKKAGRDFAAKREQERVQREALAEGAKRLADQQPKPRAKKTRRAGKRTNAKLICQVCGKRPVDNTTQGSDSTMCDPCFEYAGWENTHSDDGHEEAYAAGRLINAEECPVCVEAGYVGKSGEVHKKAVAFETDAKRAGWAALARNGQSEGLSLVTANRADEEIEIFWLDGVFQYDRTRYRRNGGKWTKVRNASAARKLLAAS